MLCSIDSGSLADSQRPLVDARGVQHGGRRRKGREPARSRGRSRETSRARGWGLADHAPRKRPIAWRTKLGPNNANSPRAPTLPLLICLYSVLQVVSSVHRRHHNLPSAPSSSGPQHSARSYHIIVFCWHSSTTSGQTRHLPSQHLQHLNRKNARPRDRETVRPRIRPVADPLHHPPPLGPHLQSSSTIGHRPSSEKDKPSGFGTATCCLSRYILPPDRERVAPSCIGARHSARLLSDQGNRPPSTQ